MRSVIINNRYCFQLMFRVRAAYEMKLNLVHDAKLLEWWKQLNIKEVKESKQTESLFQIRTGSDQTWVTATQATIASTVDWRKAEATSELPDVWTSLWLQTWRQRGKRTRDWFVQLPDEWLVQLLTRSLPGLFSNWLRNCGMTDSFINSPTAPLSLLCSVLVKLIWDLQTFLSVLDSENLSYIAQAQKKSISELLSKLQTPDAPGRGLLITSWFTQFHFLFGPKNGRREQAGHETRSPLQQIHLSFYRLGNINVMETFSFFMCEVDVQLNGFLCLQWKMLSTWWWAVHHCR